MDFAEKINNLIAQHGPAMTLAQHEKALDLWDRGVVRREDVARDFDLLKAELERPDLSPLQRAHRAARQNRPQNLTGHQMAAMKAGLDVNTPGLESMTFEQMQHEAAKVTDAKYEVERQKQARHYGRSGLPVDRNGCVLRDLK